MIENIRDIKSIYHYNSCYELLNENTDRDFWEENDFNDDDICFLQHFDDFEGYTYYIINYEYVIVTICEDVEGEVITLEKFISETLKLLEEDREEREENEE